MTTKTKTKTETVRERVVRLLLTQLQDPRLRAYILGGLRAHTEPTEDDAAEVDAVTKIAARLVERINRIDPRLGFLPDPDCDNCDGGGFFEKPDEDSDGTPCHFCLSDAIRAGELDGVADDVEYKGGKPVGGRDG